jgi:branched-chain amino acid transport system permease protein
MVFGAILGIVIERLILRRMTGRPVYAVLLVMVGVLLLVEPIVTTIWRNPQPKIETPWALDTVSIGDVRVLQLDIVTVVIAAIVLIRSSCSSLPSTASPCGDAVDQETALLQGINVNRIVALSWAIAGVVPVPAACSAPAPDSDRAAAGIGSRAEGAPLVSAASTRRSAPVSGLTIGIAEV